MAGGTSDRNCSGFSSRANIKSGSRVEPKLSVPPSPATLDRKTPCRIGAPLHSTKRFWPGDAGRASAKKGGRLADRDTNGGSRVEIELEHNGIEEERLEIPAVEAGWNLNFSIQLWFWSKGGEN